MPDNDDLPIGQLLSRREALIALGATGVALVTGCSSSSGRTTDSTGAAAAARVASANGLSCVVRPEQTQGPYFVDEMLNRSDIRADPSDGTVKAGVPLTLSLYVSRIAGTSCAAIAGALVDLWQCDADGVYSDVVDPTFNTRGKRFLRGYQVTDAAGQARFTTIYPGWYPGRTVHIHFKVRTRATTPAHEFTSQLYFDDALTDAVHARTPYAAKGRRDQRNSDDWIYRRGGDQLLVALSESGDGYAGDFRIGLQA